MGKALTGYTEGQATFTLNLPVVQDGKVTVQAVECYLASCAARTGHS